MRSFVKFLLSLVFVLGLPVVLWLAVPKLNGFSMTTLETGLRQHQAYVQLNDLIQKQAGATTDSNDPGNQIGALVKEEITADYLQGKIETLLNQTADWATAKTATPPSISLNDLQQKIEAKSPLTKQQIDDALSQLKAQQGQLPQGDDAKTQQAMQQFLDLSHNLDRVAGGDWTFSLAQPLAGLPTAMKWYTIGLPVAALILALCLMGILFLGVGWAHRLKGVAWVLLLTGVWNGILSTLFWYIFLGKMILNLVPGAADMSLLTATLASVQESLFARYAWIEIIASLSLVIIGFVLFVVASKINKPVEVTRVEGSTTKMVEVESIVPQDTPAEAKVEVTKVEKTDSGQSHFLAAAEAEAKKEARLGWLSTGQ